MLLVWIVVCILLMRTDALPPPNGKIVAQYGGPGGHGNTSGHNQGIAEGMSYAEMYRAQRAAQQAHQAEELKKLQVASLLKQTPTASLGFLFGGLIWRSLAAFEEVSQRRRGFVKTISLPPTLMVLVANVLGFVINIIKPNIFRNDLNVDLPLDLVRQWADLAYCFVMVLIRPWTTSKVPRELYFGRMFISLWWLTLCFGFSRSRWVSPAAPLGGDERGMGGTGARRPPSLRRGAAAGGSSARRYT